MKNKYEKKIEELQKKVLEEEKKYEAEAEAIDLQIRKNMRDYDAQIGVINPLRHELRVEIRRLYDFLKGLGNIGKAINVFDFTVEDLAANDGGRLMQINKEDYSKPERKPGHPSNPFGIRKAIKYFSQRSKDKKAYFEMENLLESTKCNLANDIAKRTDRKNFYSTAAKIADTYRCTLAMVKDAIDLTIIPELSGIEAFLSAAAIKDCIISNQDPRLAMPAKIDEFEGTLFDCHYIFVKNCVDFYTLIVNFFTKTVLTNIVGDEEITKQEQETFDDNVKKISEASKHLKSLVKFGEA